MSTPGLKLESTPPHPQLDVKGVDIKDVDWKDAYEDVRRRDESRIRDHDRELDTLLVFAGLFSAIQTAFIIDVYKALGADYAPNSAIKRSPTVVPVLILWFIALFLGLLSALFCIFAKQWLHTYSKWDDIAHRNIRKGLALRSFYKASFREWKVYPILAALGLSLQFALGFFVLGLAAYLWALDFALAAVATSCVLVITGLSLAAIGIPFYRQDCPYKLTAQDWEEKDIPMALERLCLNPGQSSLDLAISQTVLLLDWSSMAKFESLLASSSWSEIHIRVQNVSSNSLELLGNLVTDPAVLRDVSDEEGKQRLLALWHATFGGMVLAPTSILRATRYLEACITGGKHETAAWIIKIDGVATSYFNALMPVPTIAFPSDNYFTHANFARDGSRVFWGSREGPLIATTLNTQQSVQFNALGYSPRSRPVAVSCDQKYVLIASETSSAILCDAETGEVLITLEEHSKRICRAAFAPMLPPRGKQQFNAVDESFLLMKPPVATSSFDNTVRIWDVDTGACLAVFDELGVSVNGVCWSPDATMIAISQERFIRVYHAASRELLCVLDGHEKLVANIAFSPNSQFIASGANDHTVRIWSIAKKTCVAILSGADEFNDVEFSP
ncbi:WD40 repeat-like protein [Mycena kentingensis (nom. inval.)]|nr:WD40 repeat-like protein [Mycena kentingensis (nom. inval.)]